MNAPEKKKLCWNCDAGVMLEEENCTYCGVYLGVSSISGSEGNDLLAPPYRVVESVEEEQAPVSPYQREEVQPQPQARAIDPDEYDQEARDDLMGIGLPLILLLSGSVFFLFGLILLLFSDHGVFTLQWNATYWYLWMLFGAPLLFLGWSYLQQVTDE